MSALERWARSLRAWTIPQAILEAAPESPYGFPVDCFRRRGERSIDAEPVPTTRRALEALAEGGSVLDVGAGGGSTSLPLASRAARITAVDTSQAMLSAFLQTSEAAGVEPRVICGEWPEVAPQVEPADVVLCGHVFYNVWDLRPFVRELTGHARHRVVVELTDRHPWSWMNDLWKRFHGLERPDGPTADDAELSLRELGLSPGRDDRLVTPSLGGFERREDAVALVRRRLCLPADRDTDVERAIGDRVREDAGLWTAGPGEQAIVTLWWDPVRPGG